MIAPDKTYGELWLDGGIWKLTCEPHVTMMAKRIFQRIPRGAAGVFELTDTPETCRLLQWFMQMYPLKVKQRQHLDRSAAAHIHTINRLSDIIGPNYQPRSFSLAEPLREYQNVAVDLYLTAGSLLLADELGLGKTASAIGSLTDSDTLPALVVCPSHLTRQWEREINRFAPGLITHVLKKATPYELPLTRRGMPDVLIASYHKMHGWADTLGRKIKSVIFDEGQELRKSESNKYAACRHVAWCAQYRIALTATPIYNYGGEIFNVLDVTHPGKLGEWDEFSLEWCDSGDRDKASLKDPVALGSWLREQGIMLRRTRRDVGRELPPLSKLTVPIDCNAEALREIEDAAHELAQIIMFGTGAGFDKMQAASELDVMVRQATGIAKAPHVAAFVEMLLDNGEPIVLFGWHRSVYDLWASILAKRAPAFYTGNESSAKKQAELDRFLEGQTDLLIVSLRSGAGLDGLQHRCRTVVFGELDWAYGVHSQCIGRVFRDGQKDPVTAYFLLADEGSDPLVVEINGIKREQVDGITNDAGGPIEQVAPADGIRRLAERYATRRGGRGIPELKGMRE